MEESEVLICVSSCCLNGGLHMTMRKKACKVEEAQGSIEVPFGGIWLDRVGGSVPEASSCFELKKNLG